MLMSSDKIKEAALSQFALDGYEGASLRKIADEVGIKKPSIYAHYKNKDDLFIHVVEYVFQLERRRILAYFQEQLNRHSTLEETLHGFFDWFGKEFESQDAAKLLMRVSYFPPPSLNYEVSHMVYPFLDGLERVLAKFLVRQSYERTHAAQIAISYMTLVDGTTVELLYGGMKRYQKRVEAAWPVFWHGLQLFHTKESSS